MSKIVQLDIKKHNIFTKNKKMLRKNEVLTIKK